ncbi:MULTISPECIES: hypothetical protein [Ralstonia]|jgi:hypothetical protein|uniref:Uncharacterized protein n=2 Tax=Ralstonia pickettii TaxID=329 RepID=R0E6J4_RALPI|nr:hypothetical protein [Ralstonia pickettii]ENZ77719.1 hypothetical protein OR214_01995 [Ralstonia pickettii OR214]MCM3583880.1 hypothetical protein [Ralstonia pickettii]
MTAAGLTTEGVERSDGKGGGIEGPAPPDGKPNPLASLVWLSISLSIGVAIALWVFHKVQFEQQADGVMTATFAESLGLIEGADGHLGQIERVWFARSAAGGYLYRAVYQSTDGHSGVIRRTTRVDLIRYCKAAQAEGCRMLNRK